MQFHPTGMVWPPSVRGILVTEGVRGDGGTLKNTESKRFMFNYIPEFFRAETAETEKEADAWYEDKRNNRRTPDLLPRDEVARAINSEVKAGRGTPHGGVFLDIASRRPPTISKAPSVDYRQFRTGGCRHHQRRWKWDRPATIRWAAYAWSADDDDRSRTFRPPVEVAPDLRSQAGWRQLAVRIFGIRPARGLYAAEYVNRFPAL